ncbi:GNAT family N-acetyltransferase [Cuniculiplasma sp. SKW3]|uniref:GNAT family N-acetyltransferase n=1 Tax=unclassified Cuniculiplasma TaxID=2619706 RepID=UPI003FD0D437
MEKYNLQSIIDKTMAILDMKGLNDEFFQNLGMKRVKIEGIKGYVSPINSEKVNHVGIADLKETEADYTIEKVIDFYKKENKSFSWIIGPTSRPKDLRERLIRYGFNYDEEGSAFGMAMRTKDVDLKINPAFDVESVSLDFLNEHIDLMVNSFGMGMDNNAAMAVLMMARALNSTERYGDQIKAYVAREKTSGELVGFSILELDIEDHFGILDGAAVMPKYRGRGIYKNMVWARVKDAEKLHIEYLIIHAMKNTSAPICERSGFEKMCELNSYSYKIS